MRKPITLLLILLSNLYSFGQKLPNTFKVGNYVEVLPGDSIKIYYSCTGVICHHNCASFYRIGKIDTGSMGTAGEFYDYDMQGHLIYKAQMVRGRLTGNGYFYYPGGGIKETGSYDNDERHGIWRYYYPNGSAEKVLDFEGGTPDILQQYSADGVATVSDGNGVYTGRFLAHKQCGVGYFISGNVKNGKMDGEWKFSVLATEIYDNGKFEKGINDRAYGGGPYVINKPRIELSGFYTSENTMMDENYIGCPGDQLSFCEFKSRPLAQGFYLQLIQKIREYPNLKNQWLLIGIDFKDSGSIKQVNVYSSKNDTGLEQFIYDYIRGLRGWKPGSTTSEGTPPLFFTINIDKSAGTESVLIPAEYLSRQGLLTLKGAGTTNP